MPVIGGVTNYPTSRMTGKGFVHVDIDDVVTPRIEGIKHEFPAIMRHAQAVAGEEIMLPRLRSLSPSIVRDSMIVKAREDTLALTTRLTNRGKVPRAVVAYLNWGGVIRKDLHPVNKHALRFANGRFAMSVHHGRKNSHPRYFMELARQQALPAYSARVGEVIGEELKKRFT